MKNFKEKGITLIALVVTIIILLILAGVTIGMATSGTGLFDKAKEATEKYQNAQMEEEMQLAKYSNEIDNYVSGNRGDISITTLYKNLTATSNPAQITLSESYKNFKMIFFCYTPLPNSDLDISTATTFPVEYIKATQEEGAKFSVIYGGSHVMNLLVTDDSTFTIHSATSGMIMKAIYGVK